VDPPAAKAQPAAEIGATSAASDAAVQKSKKPQAEIAKQQVVAQAGDTVRNRFLQAHGRCGRHMGAATIGEDWLD
jgi:hypothetical protein